MAGIVADVMSNPTIGPTNPDPYWNGLIQFAVFMAFAMLLDTLRAIIDDQWSRVEKEEERSTGLRELNDAKDTLLHAVSHDLKSPLAGILGAMQTIRRDPELHLTEEERTSLYEVIEQSGRKMNRLIDDLLDLDRIDRGKLLPQRKPTDIGRARAPDRAASHRASPRTPCASKPIPCSWTSIPPRSTGSSRTCSSTPRATRRRARPCTCA